MLEISRSGQPGKKEGNRVKKTILGSAAVISLVLIILVLTWGSPPGAAVAL
jgi:hypothetical protein